MAQIKSHLPELPAQGQGQGWGRGQGRAAFAKGGAHVGVPFSPGGGTEGQRSWPTSPLLSEASEWGNLGPPCSLLCFRTSQACLQTGFLIYSFADIFVRVSNFWFSNVLPGDCGLHFKIQKPHFTS